MLVLPLVTMRLLAEERKLGTLELLWTLPVRDGEVIAGKFLAALVAYLAMLLATTIGPVVLWLMHPFAPGPVLAGYVGMLLLGAAFIACGLAASAVTESQGVSALLTYGVLVLSWFLAWNEAALSERIAPWVTALSLFDRFYGFAQGAIDSRDVAYLPRLRRPLPVPRAARARCACVAGRVVTRAVAHLVAQVAAVVVVLGSLLALAGRHFVRVRPHPGAFPHAVGAHAPGPDQARGPGDRDGLHLGAVPGWEQGAGRPAGAVPGRAAARHVAGARPRSQPRRGGAARRQRLQRRGARIGRAAGARRHRERGSADGSAAGRRGTSLPDRLRRAGPRRSRRARRRRAPRLGRGGGRPRTRRLRRAPAAGGGAHSRGRCAWSSWPDRSASCSRRSATRSKPGCGAAADCSSSRIRTPRARWRRCWTASASCSTATSSSTSRRLCSAPTASPRALPR